MTRISIAVAAIAPILGLAACATDSGAGESAEGRMVADEDAIPYLEAAATGEPRTCLMTTQIRSTRGLSDGAILFRTSGGDLYRNELPNRCPGARRDAAFSYRVPTSQLCRGEILRFFDPTSGMEYGSCGLGEFVPIEDPDEVDG